MNTLKAYCDGMFRLHRLKNMTDKIEIVHSQNSLLEMFAAPVPAQELQDTTSSGRTELCDRTSNDYVPGKTPIVYSVAESLEGYNELSEVDRIRLLEEEDRMLSKLLRKRMPPSSVNTHTDANQKAVSDDPNEKPASTETDAALLDSSGSSEDEVIKSIKKVTLQEARRPLVVQASRRDAKVYELYHSDSDESDDEIKTKQTRISTINIPRHELFKKEPIDNYQLIRVKKDRGKGLLIEDCVSENTIKSDIESPKDAIDEYVDEDVPEQEILLRSMMEVEKRSVQRGYLMDQDKVEVIKVKKNRPHVEQPRQTSDSLQMPIEGREASYTITINRSAPEEVHPEFVGTLTSQASSLAGHGDDGNIEVEDDISKLIQTINT